MPSALAASMVAAAVPPPPVAVRVPAAAGAAAEPAAAAPAAVALHHGSNPEAASWPGGQRLAYAATAAAVGALACSRLRLRHLSRPSAAGRRGAALRVVGTRTCRHAEGDAEPAAVEAEVVDVVNEEAEKMFREAYEAELERSRLLQTQLEAALAEKLGGSGMQISVQAKEVPSPLQVGSTLTWRQAYESAKSRTADLEQQLSKARGIGAQTFVPPPPPTAADTQRPKDPAMEAGLDRGEAEVLRGVGVTDDQFQQVKRLREVSELAAEEDAVLRLIAAAVLPNTGGFLLAPGDAPSPQLDSLPPLAAARDALQADGGKDFVVSGAPVEFERCYVFKGAVPAGRSPGEALDAMQRRASDSARGGRPELFLQPAKEEGKSLLIMLLDSDLPNKELPAWQWAVFVLLFLVTLLASTSTSFSVVPIAQNVKFGGDDIDGLIQILGKCLPTAAGIMATVVAMETARRAVAAKYNVTLTPPFLLPAWPLASIGCLGAVTRRLSPVPSREAEFAMSLAPALSGFLVSFGCIAAGLLAGPEQDGIVNLNYQLLPLFLKLVIRPFLGAASVATNQADPFADPMNIAFPANPLLIGGLLGVILTSLSLLPIGRLDGGVLARLAAGSGAAGALGLLAWAILAVGSFSPDDAGALYLTFGICTIVWQNGVELPPREAISDLDPLQKSLGLALLVVGILLAIPGWAFPTL